MLFRGKSLGLDINSKGVSWVLASGASDAPVIEMFESRLFAEEILRPGLKEKNILAPDAVKSSLSESYLKLLTKEKRVSLSIPDTAGRVMLLDMDALFKNKEDGIDQVKWKLKKTFPVDPAELHLDYHLVRANDDGTSVLLVALMSRSVITEYEEVLEAISLEPERIDFASFNLFRVFSGRFEVSEQTTLLFSLRGVLTLLVFQDGSLDFYRSKFLGASLGDPSRMFREVNSSLLVYSDSKGGWKPSRLYYYAAPDERAMFRSVITEAIGSEPVLLDTDALIGSSKQKVDRNGLHDILSALGAASRSLS